jgi:adenylate kinase family enzyme
MKFERIYITGIGGMGKTYFANELSKITGLKAYDLDDIVFKKDSYIREEDYVRDRKLNKLIERKRWIIEGSYTKQWVEPIIRNSDLVVLLRVKSSTAKKRILLRYFKNLGRKNRRKENLKDIFTMVSFVREKHHNKKAIAMKKMTNKFGRKMIVLNNKKDIRNFIENQKEVIINANQPK